MRHREGTIRENLATLNRLEHEYRQWLLPDLTSESVRFFVEQLRQEWSKTSGSSGMEREAIGPYTVKECQESGRSRCPQPVLSSTQ